MGSVKRMLAVCAGTGIWTRRDQKAGALLTNTPYYISGIKYIATKDKLSALLNGGQTFCASQPMSVIGLQKSIGWLDLIDHAL